MDVEGIKRNTIVQLHTKWKEEIKKSLDQGKARWNKCIKHHEEYFED